MINPEVLALDDLPCVLFCDRANLPEKSAVYFLHSNDGVLYIGMSKNLKSRWKSHHALGAATKVKGAVISWLETPQESLRLTEKAMIQYFKPPYNLESVSPVCHIKVTESTHKTLKDLAKASGKTFMGYMEHLARKLGGKK